MDRTAAGDAILLPAFSSALLQRSNCEQPIEAPPPVSATRRHLAALRPGLRAVNGSPLSRETLTKPTPLSRRARFKAAGLAGAAAVLPLAGCGSVPSSQKGVTTLRFMQNKPEVVAYFDQVIKDFEALNPDVRVIQDFNEGNFVPGLVRNDPPDVVTRGFAQATADFVHKGVFADLSDHPAAATIDPKVQDLVSSWGQYNGHETSALPFSLAAAGVIYNRDIFEAQGVSVPGTWNEFVAACGKFKAATSKNYADGNAAFAKGQAAMYLQGPWALSQLVAANKDVRLGSFPLPVTSNPADTKVRVNVDMALSITRHTPNMAAARRFVSYLLDPSVVNAYNEKNAAFSPLKEA